MLVRALMLPKEEIVIANPVDSLKNVIDKMDKNKFFSLPVVDGKKFLGLISKQTIFEEFFRGDYKDKNQFLDNNKVEDFFTRIAPRIEANDYIERASQLIEAFGISFVAVVNSYDEFEGIVTHYAIFHAFSEIFGINEGHRIAVTVYDVPGQIAKLTEIIKRSGANIISFAVIDPDALLDVKEIVIRVRIQKIDKLIEKLKDAGYKVQ